MPAKNSWCFYDEIPQRLTSGRSSTNPEASVQAPSCSWGGHNGRLARPGRRGPARLWPGGHAAGARGARAIAPAGARVGGQRRGPSPADDSRAGRRGEAARARASHAPHTRLARARALHGAHVRAAARSCRSPRCIPSRATHALRRPLCVYARSCSASRRPRRKPTPNTRRGAQSGRNRRIRRHLWSSRRSALLKEGRRRTSLTGSAKPGVACMSACVGAHLRRGLSLRMPRAARFGFAWRRGPSAARLGLRVVRFDEVWIVRAC